MTEERKQSDRRRLWFWRGAAVLTVIVFFTARFLMRDQLPVHAAKAVRQELTNTISTNGRVEPENNYEFYSPVPTTVKAVYVQPGDEVPAGKLLMVLDDVQARARVATAESGVKTAQAAVEAATHNGSQQERQAAEAETARDRLSRDQARHDLDALVKLKNRVRLQPVRSRTHSSGWMRLKLPCMHPNRAPKIAIRRQRWSGRGLG